MERSLLTIYCSLKIYLEEIIMKSSLKKSLWLVGELSFSGVVFSAELLLFRKAIFTLEGVLHDLDPDFDLDTQMMNYLSRLLLQESPDRVFSSIVWAGEKAEDYSSLITTPELQLLGHSLLMQLAHKSWSPFFLPWQGYQN